MRKPLVAGNWKMYGSKASVAALTSAVKAGTEPLRSVDIALCPPYVFLGQVYEALGNSPISLGAQNMCDHGGAGAFTGEVSGKMLLEFGCRYVIVGHSERRHIYGESNKLVARKFATAQDIGLCPILCVGETLDEREAEATEHVLAQQLDAVMAASGIDAFEQAVIAYEPVWAIGTGRTATPAQAQAAHAFIRAQLMQHAPEVARKVRILYGGSVKADNARALFAQSDVDGGLIGGASLDSDAFLKICSEAEAAATAA